MKGLNIFVVFLSFFILYYRSIYFFSKRRSLGWFLGLIFFFLIGMFLFFGIVEGILGWGYVVCILGFFFIVYRDVIRISY